MTDLIDGLTLISNFITEEEESLLVQSIDNEAWSNEIGRRTQQYGYHYSYRLRGVDELNDDGTPITPPMPDFLNFLVTRLSNLKVPEIPHSFDQIIINEYNSGQRIQPHIDSIKDWESTVVSLSVLSQWKMTFSKDDKEIDMPLPRRSLLVLQRDARYEWKHGIKGQPNGRRISLTFRKYKEKM